ncbi:hypothetical protein GH714_000100 [Hevea brasiliensis]|uniref:Uncharacterized protein n=1 Tax=Hevea brasiliensis TaxID=3981 RepID=A0A6A6KAC0_HEVBR|nr:hypothetical protein GH714_000100 [Hevea brasiliensis]
METKLEVFELYVIRKKVLAWCRVDCERHTGLRGGLCLWWNDDVQVDLLSFSLHYIDVVVEGKWQFTGLYGWLEDSQKYKTWRLLNDLKGGLMLSMQLLTYVNLMIWATRANFSHGQMDKQALGHNPIQIYFDGSNTKKRWRHKPFRFEKMWLRDLAYRVMVEEAWFPLGMELVSDNILNRLGFMGAC